MPFTADDLKDPAFNASLCEQVWRAFAGQPPLATPKAHLYLHNATTTITIGVCVTIVVMAAALITVHLLCRTKREVVEFPSRDGVEVVARGVDTTKYSTTDVEDTEAQRSKERR
jgi:hypothetical protein